MTDPSLWQGRDFRLFIGASAFAHLAYGINAVAFPWLATLLTRDPMLIGMVTMAPILPWLFFALPAGVLTDRLDHRQAIIWANVIRAALILGTFWLALTATPRFGNQFWVDLTWGGAAGANVDVIRNGVRVTSPANDGAYRESRQRGTWRYKVCQSGSTTACSAEMSISF